MISIYVDSNILIAYHSPRKSEETKKAMVKSALGAFSATRDVWLCTSVWSVTEMVNILTSSQKVMPNEVAEIEMRLFLEAFGGLRLRSVPVSPDPNYGFDEFFRDVRAGILKYHSGVGDVIHTIIMKNNGIDHILTFDEKNDFKQIPGLTVFHPRDIRI